MKDIISPGAVLYWPGHNALFLVTGYATSGLYYMMVKEGTVVVWAEEFMDRLVYIGDL